MKYHQITVPVSAELTITIADGAPDDLFSRVDTDAFDALYPWMGQEDVIPHWAHNAVANGVWDVSRLDGWIDVPRGTVTFDVDDVEIEGGELKPNRR